MQIHEQKIAQQYREEVALNVSTNFHGSGRGRGRGNGRGRGRGRGRGNNNHGTGTSSSTSKFFDKSNIECYRCHKFGNFQCECQTDLSKLCGEESNFVEQDDEEEISLLMVCYIKEETNKNLWFLDTECNNHMSGDKLVFSTLDESFKDNMKFGNNSRVAAMGKGQISIQVKGDFTHTIVDVLFVPELKTNLLSIGQLQEKDYEVSIKGRICKILDDKQHLIVEVKMTKNRLFPLYLHKIEQTCFTAKLKDEAWLWHF